MSPGAKNGIILLVIPLAKNSSGTKKYIVLDSFIGLATTRVSLTVLAVTGARCLSSPEGTNLNYSLNKVTIISVVNAGSFSGWFISRCVGTQSDETL